MPIDISCESCEKRYRVKDHHAGKTIQCPNCKGAVEVPFQVVEDDPAIEEDHLEIVDEQVEEASTDNEPKKDDGDPQDDQPQASEPARIDISCNGCGKRYALKPHHAGKTIQCPKCKGAIEVPFQVVEDDQPDEEENPVIEADDLEIVDETDSPSDESTPDDTTTGDETEKNNDSEPAQSEPASIDIACDGCGKKYLLKAHHAGKTIQCPKCKGAIEVPFQVVEDDPAVEEDDLEIAEDNLEIVSDEEVQAETSPVASEPEPEDDSEWHVQTAEGEQFGPISRAELNTWVEEGRLNDQCQVLRDGDPQWQWAEEIYPQLASGAGPMVDTAAQGGARLQSMGAKSASPISPGIPRECKKSKNGVSVVSQQGYITGEKASIFHGITLSGLFTGVHESELKPHMADFSHLSHPSGDFYVIHPVGRDPTLMMPVEIMTFLPFGIPEAVTMVEPSSMGTKVGDALSKFGGAIGAAGALTSFFSKKKGGAWTGTGTAQDFVLAIQKQTGLADKVKWDAKSVGPGPNAGTTTISMGWAVQAIPLGPQQTVIISQKHLKFSMTGPKVDVDWYIDWRRLLIDTLYPWATETPGPPLAFFECLSFLFMHELLGVDTSAMQPAW